MIAHIVLFTPKSDLPVESIRSFELQMGDCFRSIDTIARVSVGRRTAVDAGYGRYFGEQTYEFAAILEFKDPAGLANYLNHPLHHELGRMFWERCERTVISECEMYDGRDPNLPDLLAD